MKNFLLGNHIDSNNFFQYIRRFNSAFAFASFGAQTVISPGYGPFCFKIHGQIYHRSGILHPEANTNPKFGQIYILEGAGALQSRLNNNQNCSSLLMSDIQNIMTTCNNPYVSVYKNMHAVELQELAYSTNQNIQPRPVKMIFRDDRPELDSRRYNVSSIVKTVSYEELGKSWKKLEKVRCTYLLNRI